MEVSSDDIREKVFGGFPFAMVLATNLVKGSLFLLVAAPPLTLLLSGHGFRGLPELASYVKEVLRSSVGASATWASVSGFLWLSVLLGFLLTPLERGASAVVLAVIGRLFGPARIFSPQSFLAPKYPAMLAWLLKKPSEKLHWEWELFNYYASWSVFFIVTIGSSCTALILGDATPLGLLVALWILPVPYFLFAIRRSVVMASVHELYLRLADGPEKKV